PFLPVRRHRKMFPHHLSRGSEIKIPGRIGFVLRHLDVRLIVLLLPCLFEVAHPELNIANDVDGFAMLQESLRDRVYAHGLHAGVTVKRVSAVADFLAYRVLKEPMDENYVASCKLLAAAHLLFHHLAVMDDKLEIKIAHCNAGFTLAPRRLLNVAQAPTEF